MSCNWPMVSLKEAGVTLIDCDHKTPKAQNQGLPYVGIPQLKDGCISLEGVRLISEDDFHHWRRKAKPQPNDVILSRRCNPGESAYVPEGLEVALGQNLVLLRSDGNTVYPPFLRWLTRGPHWWSQVSTFINVGAVFDSLKCADIPKFEVPLPPYRVQRNIANALAALDNKIQLNHRINETLEQIAQALFNSWFVDFEPVRAKIAALAAGGSEEDALLAAMSAISGKDAVHLAQMQSEQPQQYAELRATAELFPSAMQESELGEIPEGWSPSTVGHEFDVTMGQSPPGDTYNEEGNGVPFFQGRRDFGERFPSNRVYCSAPKRMANEGDTLLSVRAPVGDTNIARFNCCIGRGLAAIRHKSSCSSFTYYSIIYLGQKLSSYDSEGTVFGSINQKNLKALPVLAPPKIMLKEFNNIVSRLDESIKTNSEQALMLAETRDTLLPKLLSGYFCHDSNKG